MSVSVTLTEKYTVLYRAKQELEILKLDTNSSLHHSDVGRIFYLSKTDRTAIL